MALTIEQYHAMVVEQNGKCARCGITTGKLVVDHNHQTGMVRQLLCHLCNAMIGCAREDMSILANTATYLIDDQQAAQADVQFNITSLPISPKDR